MNGRLYLLDLVESGVEESPRVRPPSQPSDDWTRAVSQALNPAVFPVDLIVGKLREIESFNPGLALTYVKGIRLYQWAIVAAPLVDVPDEDSVIEFPNGRPVQLAIRRDGVIRIHREHWNLLTREHQAALVFHEVSYALMPIVTESTQLPGFVECFRIENYDVRTRCLGRMQSYRQFQLSAPARAFVGYLFSHDFEGEAGRFVERPAPFRENLLSVPAVTAPMLEGQAILDSLNLFGKDSREVIDPHSSVSRVGSIALGESELSSLVERACDRGIGASFIRTIVLQGFRAKLARLNSLGGIELGWTSPTHVAVQIPNPMERDSDTDCVQRLLDSLRPKLSRFREPN